jgi:hypothetical protein
MIGRGGAKTSPAHRAGSSPARRLRQARSVMAKIALFKKFQVRFGEANLMEHGVQQAGLISLLRSFKGSTSRSRGPPNKANPRRLPGSLDLSTMAAIVPLAQQSDLLPA